MTTTQATPLKSILIQAAAMIALGGGIGVADAFIRPVKLGREAQEFTRPVAPAPSAPNATHAPKTHSGADPVVPPTPPTQQQAPAPNSGAQNAGPSAAAAPNGSFVPTPKEKLPKGQITLEDAKAAFDTGNINIIDARARDKFAEGHLPGAVRLELKDFMESVPAKLGLLDRARMTIVYCAGGHCDESERVAEQLEGSGFKPIFIIHDGFPGWKAMGYPVEVGEDIE